MAIFAATKNRRGRATLLVSPRGGGWNASPNQPPSDALSVHKGERFYLAPLGPIRKNHTININAVIPVTYARICNGRNGVTHAQY
jgi:hypothetical protein